ncbi:MAG: hypothetical protein AAFX79_13130 [Planctomycetota bacterium]
MSRKWQHAKQWDDQHLRGPLLPLKWGLRLLSSVLFGVALLVFVCLYGVLASVPVGLLVGGLTWLIYGATLLATCIVGAAVPVGVAAYASRRADKPWRFFWLFASSVAGTAAGAWLWSQALWPGLRYDPVTGEGLRLFADFVDHYDSVTIRRLPFFEMTELEFYAWWPLRVALILFIATMVVSTVRRVAFTLPNLGVLSVHTGIIMLGWGSLYYSSLKLEGDVLLFAGRNGPDGIPMMGPPAAGFYERTAVALWVSNGRGWDERRVAGVPRYNVYDLDAGAGESALELAGLLPEATEPDRDLDLLVPPPRGGVSDADIEYRIVGYAPYAEARTDWLRAEPAAVEDPRPVRFIEMYSGLDADGRVADATADAALPIFRFYFVPDEPVLRIAQIPGTFGIEYVRGGDEQAWRELTAPVPAGLRHALAITPPGATEPFIAPAEPGSAFEHAGIEFEVERVMPQPPFPIITEGYEGSTSSVAIVKITPPEGGPFTRWIYSRFPEISQDLDESGVAGDGGRPARQRADESIVRVRYLDLSALHVAYVEDDDRTRMAIRGPGNEVTIVEGVGIGDRVPIVPGVALEISGAWPHARAFERPAIVPEVEQDMEFVGTHDRAMVAVEVSLPAAEGRPAFSRIVWIPFSKYLDAGQENKAAIDLPDGRHVQLAFGRAMRRLPGFQVRLADFEMVSYDHRGAPRDYRSTVLVEPSGPDEWFEPYTRKTQLNAPLRAPFVWSEERSLPANIAGFFGSRLDPSQFKFAQAGWDAQGWERTQALADAGEIPRPYAQFTILHVGNNPGIHVIALGGVLMAVGTPWAFYVKPWMVRRQKRALAERVAQQQQQREVAA